LTPSRRARRRRLKRLRSSCRGKRWR
jgi:hypothetical protein